MKFNDIMRIKYTILTCLLFASFSAAAQQKKTEKTPQKLVPNSLVPLNTTTLL